MIVLWAHRTTTQVAARVLYRVMAPMQLVKSCEGDGKIPNDRPADADQSELSYNYANDAKHDANWAQGRRSS